MSESPKNQNDQDSPTNREILNQHVATGAASGPWDRIGTSLFLAGGAYPLLLWGVVPVWGIVVLVASLFRGDFEPLYYAPIFMATSLVAALIAGCFTLFYTGVITAFALLGLAGAVRLLGLRQRWEALGAFSGSWVAFLCFLPPAYLTEFRPEYLPEAWPAVVGGPMLAIAWGMLVGAYMGIGNHRRFSRNAGASGKLRFSIRQVMTLMLIASVVLAALRLAQMLNSVLLFSLGLWLGCFVLFYLPTTRLARCLYRRRSRRYLRYRRRRRILSRQASGAEEPQPAS